MSRRGANLRENAIRGNLNNLRAGAVRQSALRADYNGVDIYALPWAWLVDARQPGTLFQPTLPGDLLTAGQWTLGAATQSSGDVASGYTIESIAAGATVHLWRGSPTNVSTAPWSWGLDVKAGTNSWIAIVNSTNQTWVNSTTGALGTQVGGITFGTATNLGSGWWRVPMTATSFITGNELRIYATNADGALTSTAAAAGEVMGMVRNVGPFIQNQVQSWPDLIAGRNAVQATPANRPIWIANGFNGQPCVRSDGVDDFLFTAAPNQAQPCEVFVVGRVLTGTAFSSYLHATGGTNQAIGFSAATTLRMNFGAPTLSLVTASLLDRALWFDAQVNGATSELATVGASLAGATGAAAHTGVTLFARSGSTVAANFCLADLSWAGIANRLLTATERSLLTQWAQQQWGPLV